MTRQGTPLFAVPSPCTLRATAVWITLRSWLQAACKRFETAQIVTPDGPMALAAVDQLVDGADRTPSARRRSPRAVAARTFAKDLRTAAIHVRGSRAPKDVVPLSDTTPFVWQHHDPFFRLGTVLAHRTEAPLVQFVDAPHVWEGNRWGTARPGWGALLERFGETPQLRAADLILCVSKEVAAAVADITDGCANVRVTPCTPDPAFFEVRGRQRTRAALGAEPDAVVFGWAGSFRRFHAVDHLLEAFARIRCSMPNTRLLMIGDGPERPRLEARAVDLGIADAVTFTGRVPFSAMPRHIAAIDVAVATARDRSSFHYSPLKLREYRASGRAVVAPDAGQAATVVAHAVDGLLYPPGDVEALAEALCRVGSDADLRSRLGAAASEAERSSAGTVGHVDLVLDELQL